MEHDEPTMSTTPEPNREKELFSAALDLPTADRDAFLSRECAGNDALRERIAGLLRAHAGADDVFPTEPDGLAEIITLGQTHNRVRSYSMNGFVSGGLGRGMELSEEWNAWGSHFYPNSRYFRKQSDIKQPSKLFVILEENPQGIDNGGFHIAEWANKPTDTIRGNVPADYHGKSTIFTYADGSASAHKW